MQEIKLTEAGIVISIQGKVSVISSDGQVRVLKPGDQLQVGDIVLTSTNSKAIIQFEEHNSPITVNESCAACILINNDEQISANIQNVDADIFDETDVQALQQLILDGVDPTDTSSNDEIADLQKLIAEGIDPTSTPEFEAAAAGISGNQGSTVSPRIDATIEQIDVTSGYDTDYASSSIDSTENTEETQVRKAIISGEDEGTTIEDITTRISGKLEISDTNIDESRFNISETQTQYGVLTIDESGNWVYVLNNDLDLIQTLDEGETLSESITVISIDGTEHVISIVIEGNEDLSQISL
ncbi:hypothetical protein CJF42_19480, partial [Pseudoalteromonas sp. NBT06-2]|uniref:retention module-containing protein n=1 Tax=Pseudoalteromonas sp. NBT06-2 TaxID=2025950 RepID=UPI000BC9BFBC